MPTETAENPTDQPPQRKAPPKESVLYTWVAPSRPFKRHGREFYVTLISIAALLGIILFLVEGVLPVILIASLVFLFYVMSNVEPEKIEYKITTVGLRVGNKLTKWNTLTSYWFTQRLNTQMLVLGTLTFPGRLEFIVTDENSAEIKKVLDEYLPQEQKPPVRTDKAINWVSSKLPQD